MQQPCFSKWPPKRGLWWFYFPQKEIIWNLDPENIYFGTGQNHNKTKLIYSLLLKKLYVLRWPCFSKWPPKWKLWWYHFHETDIGIFDPQNLYFGIRIMKHIHYVTKYVCFIHPAAMFSKWPPKWKLWWYHSLENDITGILDTQNLYLSTRIMPIHLFTLKVVYVL